MTKAVGDLVTEGYSLDDEILAGLSPFKRRKINRFGIYPINMDREKIDIHFDLPTLE